MKLARLCHFVKFNRMKTNFAISQFLSNGEGVVSAGLIVRHANAHDTTTGFKKSL